MNPTVPHRAARFLMLWLFVALQAMTPLIHAHAGAVQLSHADFLHVHQGLHSDAAYHVIAADEHGAEVEVAKGMPLRNGMLGAAAEAPLAMTLTLPRADMTERPAIGLPPPLDFSPPDYILPHALAPPLA
ncbi:MAG: hypothetical protein KKE84_06920 [Gammaproteobacteria bacterium]|nr:hypothetical protein [Gammaproteobacteria bacterium]